MKINIRARHVDISPSLKEYAQKKMEKLDRFFENIQEIVVEFDISDNSDEETRQIAAATIWASGTVIRAKETSSSLYASIDAIFDKLERQLKKHHDKLKSRRNAMTKEDRLDALITAQNNHTSNKKKAVRHYHPKPLDPQDAAQIADLEHLSFLMFRNSHTEEINVIYPLDEGGYGLIEP